MTKLSEAAAAELFGNRFLTEAAPARTFPEHGMRPVDAMRLVDEDLALEGDPMRNLATFVTTWMEPEAQRIIAENLHRNFIDHAEYPQTAEIEQRCIRMLADLFNAPGETTGARTQGSSEAIMLGALSLKWKWRQRREAAGKDTTKPNIVVGCDGGWASDRPTYDATARCPSNHPRGVMCQSKAKSGGRTTTTLAAQMAKTGR